MEPMESVVRLFSALVPSAWVAAAAAYLVLFVRQDAGAERWAPRLAWTAVAVHLAGLGATGLLGVCPMLLPGSVVSGLGLAVGVVHLVLEGRAKDRAIGVFPISAAAIFAVAAAAADPLRRPDASVPTGTTAVHVMSVILGYAGLLLAALFGALYLVQQRALKAKKFGLFWERLPSLELLDQFSRRSLAAAVLFLTLTIAFGHLVRRAVGVPPGESYWVASIVTTNALWLAGLAVVVGRRFLRFRPGPAATASVLLFALAMANLFVVEFIDRAHGGR
jgi:ABC-type uncharacterized transport system permease subunit